MSTTDHAPQTYLALPDGVLQQSTQHLQTILANTLFMYNLYKKYHRHVDGPAFYQYHLLFDKHADEQLPLADAVAERLRTLGSPAPGMPADIVANASLSETESVQHDPPMLVRNLLAAHESYIGELRQAIKVTEDNGDDGTNDLLVSQLLRTHELQVWFIRSSVGPEAS